MDLPIKGHVWVRKNGLLVAEGSNLVVAQGKNTIANLLGSTDTQFSHMAIGNSSSATTDSMTALQGTEGERVALSSTVVASNVVTYAALFGLTLSSSLTVREIGIFNAAAGGDMLCRFICSGFSLAPSERCNVSWALTIG